MATKDRRSRKPQASSARLGVSEAQAKRPCSTTGTHNLTRRPHESPPKGASATSGTQHTTERGWVFVVRGTSAPHAWDGTMGWYNAPRRTHIPRCARTHRSSYGARAKRRGAARMRKPQQLSEHGGEGGHYIDKTETGIVARHCRMPVRRRRAKTHTSTHTPNASLTRIGQPQNNPTTLATARLETPTHLHIARAARAPASARIERLHTQLHATSPRWIGHGHTQSGGRPAQGPATLVEIQQRACAHVFLRDANDHMRTELTLSTPCLAQRLHCTAAVPLVQ